MTYLTPYRTQGEMSSPKPKNTYGLIRMPKPHSCNKPGFLLRVLYFLTFRPIRDDSLFRCQCGRVWRFDDRRYAWIGSWTHMLDGGHKLWEKAGGEVEDDDDKK